MQESHYSEVNGDYTMLRCLRLFLTEYLTVFRYIMQKTTERLSPPRPNAFRGKLGLKGKLLPWLGELPLRKQTFLAPPRSPSMYISGSFPTSDPSAIAVNVRSTTHPEYGQVSPSLPSPLSQAPSSLAWTMAGGSSLVSYSVLLPQPLLPRWPEEAC